MKKFFFKNKYTILLIALPVALFFVFHDFSSYPKSLDPIFKMAGSNQSELKKVIRHYSWFASDSLKRKAAIFLIENMDAHYSYQSDEWEKCQVELDTLFKKEHEESRLKHGFDSIYQKYDLSNVRYVSDLNLINAKFLIKCIDAAFEKWKSPYAKHLRFDEFCEYLLPYRGGHEPLVDWRKEFNKQYIPEMLSTIKKSKDSVSSVDICEALRELKDGYLNYLQKDVPDYNVHMLLSARVASCKEYSLKILLAARCIGLPVVLDFTPQWATRSIGHEWNALITWEGKPLSFGIKDNCKLGMHVELIPDRIASKVYRQTFAKQKGSLGSIHGLEEIPPTLASPCMKDVTKDYYSTVDVPVKFNFKAPGHNHFAYLAVFNNKDWIPISWAKIMNGEAIFKDLHKGILCVPGYYFKKQFIPSAYPVKIDSLGVISIIKPDLKNTQKLVLSRKYQTGLVDGICKKMLDARLQASNDSNFIHAVDLYKVTEKPQACYQIVHIKQPKAYKYYRYLSPKQVTCNIAELEFYESVHDTKLVGTVFGGYQKRYDTTISDFELLKVPFYIRLQRSEANNYQIAPILNSNIYLFFKSSILEHIFSYNNKKNVHQAIISNTQTSKKDSKPRVLPDTCYVNAFDGDPLTSFCRFGLEYSWVGLEFKKTVRVNKIIYLPRNDDNCIRDGELYELFYWDNKWISLGQQTGSNKTYRLTYHNVPTNALLLLHDLTKGTEERIFTYEKGEQVWW
jgi:hypothetical protein